MTTVDPRSNLAALVREHLAAARQRTVTRNTTTPAEAGASTAAATLLDTRIRALDAADPDRPRHAVRLYLESQLVQEFGPGLLNDPSFAPVVEAVQAQMQGDKETAAAVDALGAWLVSQDRA